MDTAATESVPSQTTPIDSSKARRAWNDAPLRIKAFVLLFVGIVGGGLVGLVEVHLYHQIWPLSLGLSLLVIVLGWLANHWIFQPVENLLALIRRIAESGDTRDPEALKQLPVGREDEMGELARLIHLVTAVSIRDHNEINHLRRTLDDRIAQATKVATLKLHRLTMRDPLTGLGNRRFLEENLDPLVASVLASQADLACLMLDMDNFKQINDTWGHAEGDNLLVFLGGLIRATTRQKDYAVRLGGDEFVVLIPACSMDRIRHFAERLQALMRQHTHSQLPSELPVDISIGVATLHRDRIKNGQVLLEKADANLKAAKEAGKGCVVGA